jgi:hypothetical protein
MQWHGWSSKHVKLYIPCAIHPEWHSAYTDVFLLSCLSLIPDQDYTLHCGYCKMYCWLFNCHLPVFITLFSKSF